jgi:toxin HigB-1
MIKTFKNKYVKKLFNRETVLKWKHIEQLVREKLEMLNSTPSLEFLGKIVSNLHKLKDDRKDQWAFNITNKYRVCFYWKDGNVYEVEIVDYH